MRLLYVLLPLAAITVTSWAQSADKPLTNADIESMLDAGLPVNTIVMKIESAASRGLVDLDASTTALIALKQKGAREAVLNTVMLAEPSGAGLKQQREEDRVVPGLPASAGVYLRLGSGWAAPRSLTVWPPLYSAWPFSKRKRQVNVPLEGGRADLQSSELQPTFYLRKPSSGPWRIFSLESRRDQRLLALVSNGDFMSTPRFPPNQALETRMTRAAGEVYALRPLAPLAAGEYVLCGQMPGSRDLSLCYAFGIQR